MINQYFGQYLLNKGMLSSKQLCDVLVYEQSVRAFLGVIAIDAGLLNAQQVEKVLQLQHRRDQKFGEIAVEEGYLTPGQLEDLLQTQQRRYLALSQAIVDRGYLSLAQLQAALESYKLENKLNLEQLGSSHSNFDGAVRGFLASDDLGTNAENFYDYVALTMRNVVRFMGVDPFIDTPGTPLDGWLICQDIVGEVGLSIGLVMEDSVLLNLAQRYSGEELTKIDELTRDCMAEFLNENNGIFLVNMSDRGMELDLKPQQICKAGTKPMKNAYRIPIRVSYGRLDLYVAFI
jgi:CheY-specific phosphatase CheX